MLSRILLFSFFLLPTLVLTSSNKIKDVDKYVIQAENILATALKNKDPKANIMAENIEKMKEFAQYTQTTQTSKKVKTVVPSKKVTRRKRRSAPKRKNNTGSLKATWRDARNNAHKALNKKDPEAAYQHLDDFLDHIETHAQRKTYAEFYYNLGIVYHALNQPHQAYLSFLEFRDLKGASHSSRQMKDTLEEIKQYEQAFGQTVYVLQKNRQHVEAICQQYDFFTKHKK